MGKEKSKELFVVGSKKFFGSVIRKEKSYFSFDEMYLAWKEWFDEKGYFLNEKGQSESISGREMEKKIEWTAHRDITDYIRFQIDIYMWIRKMSSVIVKVKGKKQKVHRGDLFIGFKGYLVKDYKGKWKKHEFLRQMYDRYLAKDKLEMYEGKLWAETNDLIAITKKYCGMMPLKK